MSMKKSQNNLPGSLNAQEPEIVKGVNVPALPEEGKKGKFRRSGHLTDQILKYNYPKDRQPSLFDNLHSETLKDIEVAGVEVAEEVFFNHIEYPLSDFRLKLVGDGKNPRISINNDWYSESLTFGSKSGRIWSIEQPAQNVKIPPTVFLYLLSKQFDLFGLIDAGEAIDAATLTNKTA